MSSSKRWPHAKHRASGSVSTKRWPQRPSSLLQSQTQEGADGAGARVTQSRGHARKRCVALLRHSGQAGRAEARSLDPAEDADVDVGDAAQAATTGGADARPNGSGGREPRRDALDEGRIIAPRWHGHIHTHTE